MADNGNTADWVAMDLLSQAEHDEAAQAILITDDADFADAVDDAVEAILPTLPRVDVAGLHGVTMGRSSPFPIGMKGRNWPIRLPLNIWKLPLKTRKNWREDQYAGAIFLAAGHQRRLVIMSLALTMSCPPPAPHGFLLALGSWTL